MSSFVPHPISEHSSRMASSGTTPATPVEAPYPGDCPDCSWVMVRLGIWRLKMISSRCANHGLTSGFPTIPWPSRNGEWAVGRQS